MALFLNYIVIALSWVMRFFTGQIFGLFMFFVAKGFIKKIGFGIQLVLSGGLISFAVTAFFISGGALIWIFNKMSYFLDLIKNTVNSTGDFACLAHTLNCWGIIEPLSIGLSTLFYVFSTALLFKLYYVYRKLIKLISDEFAKLAIIASM